MADLNLYNVCIHDGTTYIVLGWNKFKTTYVNAPTIIQKPTTVKNRGTTTPATQTLIINLNKLNKLFTINTSYILQGQLEYSNGNLETYTNAKEKRDALMTILESGNTLTLIYDGTSYTGVIKKLEIDDEARDLQSELLDGDVAYVVTLAFVVGVDRIATT